MGRYDFGDRTRRDGKPIPVFISHRCDITYKSKIMVYVDDMYNSPVGKFGRMKMSHMLADTSEELVEMAAKIGVNVKWIQNAGTVREHFDICMSKRKKAVLEGAKEITWRESGEFILARAKAKHVSIVG